MTEIEAPYRMRGQRVPEVSIGEIDYLAERVCEVFQFTKSSFSARKIGQTLNLLEGRAGVDIDVIDNDDWLDCTKATVDPQIPMIYMPQKLHDDIARARPEAIRVLLHELGHIFLVHKPLLHSSETTPGITEDSEWQADAFADAVIKHLRLPTKEDAQMELKLF
jgi:hypothetical protein